MDRSLNLLDEALGLTVQSDLSPSSCQDGRMFLIEDCVETSGAFVIHHIIKRSLSTSDSAGVVIFVALSHPFSHYDRIMRKLGCNLAAHRNSNRFFFFDMLALKCSEGASGTKGLDELYGKILKVVQVVSAARSQDSAGGRNHITIIIEDFSLLEVASNGCSSHCLDFINYCHSLTSEFGCSLVVLNHHDIYNDSEQPTILLTEYLASVVIKTEPLTTGLAADVHGQLTVVNKGMNCSGNRLKNFQFKVKENGVECFYPGTPRT